jgi:hypothetical protein
MHYTTHYDDQIINATGCNAPSPTPIFNTQAGVSSQTQIMRQNEPDGMNHR